MVRRTIALVAVGSLLLVTRPTGQTAPPRAGRVLVPLQATIEPLLQPTVGGNAVLRVRFEDGYSLPQRFRYLTEYGPVVLADDGQGFDLQAGDGLYTALGTIDLAAARARGLRLSTSRTATPTRAWRHRSWTPVQAVPNTNWQPGVRASVEPWGDPANISAEHSLLIRDLGVVENRSRTSWRCGEPSMGKWSFGYLMEQMANTPATGVTGSQFAMAWLQHWASPQSVNGWTVNARTLVNSKIIDPWLAVSAKPGTLDLAKAPFKLLAIVNRMDLRNQAAYGGSSAGELRFVFTHTGDCDDQSADPFNVILEFGVTGGKCSVLKGLAQQWKALDAHVVGSPQYNAALEAITEQVVAANAGGLKPNGSALNQLRTNENRLDDTGGGLDWQLREFRIDPTTHLLVQVPTTQTPDRLSNFGSTSFVDYVNAHAPGIDLDDYTVPLTYPTAADPFRAGAAANFVGMFWDGSPAHPIVDRGARHKVSLNTCNACHARETHAVFTHVGRASFGHEAPLSGFLTGIWVDDVADGTPSRFFDELTRRAVDLDAILGESCFVAPLDVPTLAVSH
jgi:hypothetical protein